MTNANLDLFCVHLVLKLNSNLLKVSMKIKHLNLEQDLVYIENQSMLIIYHLHILTRRLTINFSLLKIKRLGYVIEILKPLSSRTCFNLSNLTIGTCIWIIIRDKTFRLYHVHFFLQFSIQECIVYIYLMYISIQRNCYNYNNSDCMISICWKPFTTNLAFCFYTVPSALYLILSTH